MATLRQLRRHRDLRRASGLFATTAGAVRSRIQGLPGNGGTKWAVLVRMTAAGMDAAAYDQASAQLADLVRKQPGFMMHVAYPSPGGFSVGEVWESRGQFETWFNENVKPNVPVVQHEVIELHAVVQP